jgi:hypothetical protein
MTLLDQYLHRGLKYTTQHADESVDSFWLRDTDETHVKGPRQFSDNHFVFDLEPARNVIIACPCSAVDDLFHIPGRTTSA